MVLLLASCTSMYKQAPNQTNFLVVYVYGVVLFLASFTSMYKQAPKQTFFNLFMFTGWSFYSHLLLRCTNRHQNKPFSICLCSRDGAFTKTNLSLIVYVYGVVLLLASCTLVYKHATKQAYFSCLCLWDGAFSRILYFGVQTGTKTNLFLVVYVNGVVPLLASCTSMYKQAPKQTYL